MRNTTVKTLPPHSELILTIDPPISDEEKTYLLPPSNESVVIRLIDTAHVAIVNQGDHEAFFIFSIGRPMKLPPGVYEGVSAFLTARKKAPRT